MSEEEKYGKFLGYMKWNFEKIIKKAMKIAHLSALSAAVVVNDKMKWAEGYGLYDRENKKAATEETIYLMSSLSKSITATAVMQLYEKGHYDLDDDVNEYLPFKLRNPFHKDAPITFRMLLSHTSGLALEEGDLYAKTQISTRKKDILQNYYCGIIPANLKIHNYPDPFLKEYLVPGGIYYRPLIWTKSSPGEIMVYSNISSEFTIYFRCAAGETSTLGVVTW